MAEKHFVVIGNGPAGNQAAMTLRENAPTARITIISKARESCYSPHNLPDFIAGKIREEELFLCPFGSYKENAIKLRCCQEVVGIDFRKKALILAHNEIVRFDGLIIAVGGRPRIPERLSVFQDLMFTLKTVGDAKVWIEKLSRVESVLLIGGDLSSLATAKALLHLNKKVYFMFNEDTFWPLRCNEELFVGISEKLAQGGVEVLACRSIKNIARLTDDSYEVQVDDETLQIGMVGAFFGLVPDVRFLARSGLKIDRGILVDEYLNTGFEGVYATGDCAQIYHPEIHDYWISIGHENARTLGHIAALNLASDEMKVEAKPESIFDVQGVNVNTSWWMEF